MLAEREPHQFFGEFHDYLKKLNLSFIAPDLNKMLKGFSPAQRKTLMTFGKIDEPTKELILDIQQMILWEIEDLDSTATMLAKLLEIWHRESTYMPPPILLLWITVRICNFAEFGPLRAAYVGLQSEESVADSLSHWYERVQHRNCKYPVPKCSGPVWRSPRDD